MNFKQKKLFISALLITIVLLISSIYYILIFKNDNQITTTTEKTNAQIVIDDNMQSVIKQINEPKQEIQTTNQIKQEPNKEPKPSNEPKNTNNNLTKKALSGLVIGIDAGHQSKGNNDLEKSSPNSTKTKPKVSSGTQGVSSSVYEYIVNLKVALKLQEELEELGATVIMVRETNDVDISNMKRATLMNDNNVDLCLRIHCNGSSNSKTKGAMMLLPKGNETLDIQEKSYEAGKIIFESFLKATNANNAGISYRDDLTGFNWSDIPVCLIELGFMSNKEEDLLLVTDDYQNKCVEGLVDGILNWSKGI